MGRSVVVTQPCDVQNIFHVCNEPCYFPSCYRPPSVGTIEHLREYLRISSQAIKAANPAAKVVAPSTLACQDFWEDEAGHHIIYYEDFWQGLLDEGGADYIDIISFHYPAVDTANTTNSFWDVKELKRILNNLGAGDKKIWVTEAGAWPTGAKGKGAPEIEWWSRKELPEPLAMSKEAQAKHYKEFLRAWSENWDLLDKVFFFRFVDGNWDQWSTGDDYSGIVCGNHGLSPKPAAE